MQTLTNLLLAIKTYSVSLHVVIRCHGGGGGSWDGGNRW